MSDSHPNYLPVGKPTVVPFDDLTPKTNPLETYYLVVDLEVMCDQLPTGEKVHMNPTPEIIEWASVFVHDNCIISSYHAYV